MAGHFKLESSCIAYQLESRWQILRFQRTGVQRCLMLLLLRGATHGDVVGESHQVGQKHEERGVVTLTAASFFIHQSRGLSSLTCFFQEPSLRVLHCHSWDRDILNHIAHVYIHACCTFCIMYIHILYAVNISWKHTLWVIPLHAVSYLALTYTRLKQFHDIPDIHCNSCEVLLKPSKLMQSILQSFCLCFLLSWALKQLRIWEVISIDFLNCDTTPQS